MRRWWPPFMRWVVLLCAFNDQAAQVVADLLSALMAICLGLKLLFLPIFHETLICAFCNTLSGGRAPELSWARNWQTLGAAAAATDLGQGSRNE